LVGHGVILADTETIMRATILLALAVLSSAATAGRQGDSLREAVALGQTHDDALFDSFNKGYSLSSTDTIEHAEIVTEFRRGVLIVREKALGGDYGFREAQLAKALAPHRGVVTFIVRARLHPMNTLVKEPAYDLCISTGPRSPPIPATGFKRDPIYALGPMGSPLAGVRVEASFPRADIERAAAPSLIVTDDKAEVIWQTRIDLSRYR
jgi:hypothetical protein